MSLYLSLAVGWWWGHAVSTLMTDVMIDYQQWKVSR